MVGTTMELTKGNSKKKSSNVIPFPRERIPYPKPKEGLYCPSAESQGLARYGEPDEEDV